MDYPRRKAFCCSTMNSCKILDNLNWYNFIRSFKAQFKRVNPRLLPINNWSPILASNTITPWVICGCNSPFANPSWRTSSRMGPIVSKGWQKSPLGCRPYREICWAQAEGLLGEALPEWRLALELIMHLQKCTCWASNTYVSVASDLSVVVPKSLVKCPRSTSTMSSHVKTTLSTSSFSLVICVWTDYCLNVVQRCRERCLGHMPLDCSHLMCMVSYIHIVYWS